MRKIVLSALLLGSVTLPGLAMADAPKKPDAAKPADDPKAGSGAKDAKPSGPPLGAGGNPQKDPPKKDAPKDVKPSGPPLGAGGPNPPKKDAPKDVKPSGPPLGAGGPNPPKKDPKPAPPPTK